MSGCFRCHKNADVASFSPLGGVVLCEGCVEVVLSKTVAAVPLYFGRCYRDAFRLCLPECSHLELGPTVDRNGEPRVESATCLASVTTFESQVPEGGVMTNAYPVTLRRRTTDEYLAALLLTTRPQELQEVAEQDIAKNKAEADAGGPVEDDDLSGYREGIDE
jgi:hypothetical protein